MASLGYFNYFPKLVYTFDKNTLNNQAVTNIFARSAFLKEIVDNSAIYFEYEVQDSDTPEIIAHKIYGSAFRSWLVLLFNKYVNPLYEFPMKSVVLDEYVKNKYDQTITQAQTTIHHYEQEITTTITFNGVKFYESSVSSIISDKEYNFVTETLVDRTVPGTADTSVVVSTEQNTLANGQVATIVTRNKAVSNYQNEINENEKRRKIKLLDPAYVTRVEQEFKQLMSQ
jgi:hypothetical protein